MLKISRLFNSLVVSCSVLTVFSQPVFAAIRDDGDEPGVSISGSAAIALFIGLPLLISGLVALAILAPQWSRRARRESWWLNGPGNEAKHLEIESSEQELKSLALKAGGVSAKW